MSSYRQQDWKKPINESVVHTVLGGSRTVASVGDRVEDRDTSRPLRRRNTVPDRTSEAPRSSLRTTTNTASQYHFSICVVMSYSTKNWLFDRALFCRHERVNEPLFTVYLFRLFGIFSIHLCLTVATSLLGLRVLFSFDEVICSSKSSSGHSIKD